MIVVEMTADFVVSSKIFVEVTVNQVCTTAIETTLHDQSKVFFIDHLVAAGTSQAHISCVLSFFLLYFEL